MGKWLVVDDEEMLRVCVAAILGAVGHEVILARDGLEAYELYQRHQVDISLIVMDITMPRLNGVDAAQMIKEIDPSAKVVLMSGNAEQLPREAKVDAFLPKPFRANELHQVVQMVLGEDRPAPWRTQEGMSGAAS